MTFRVRHNFDRSQPKWTGTYRRQFGERNEGFLLDATDETDAKRRLGELPINLNPFYLTITPERS